jgi:CO/xanthine dehydrogenase Mo-binding subunit
MTAPTTAPTTALTGALAEHPRLDQWVAFPAPGRVTVYSGKVEIGQGVLTAMVQLAAEELDVAPSRIAIAAGDTDHTPNEGFTAGSQSMQFGGVALRQACAEVRALFLRHAAAKLGCGVDALAVADGRIVRDGTPTTEDYWTLAPSVSLATTATGGAARKPRARHSVVGQSEARLDLPAKVFGAAIFLHDMALDGMRHARVVRQPRRGATIGPVDEAAIRKAARGAIEIVRHGSFLAIVGDDETAVEAAAVAAETHVRWLGVEPINPAQQQASALLQQPTIDRTVGAPPSDAARRTHHEATYTRGYLAHASIAPSCALAQFRDGHLTVWTHAQGVFPLRASLAQSLKLDPKNISVRHVQGPGCYGHNGADDVAADAAIIATLMPGKPIRVRWRREEEFAFEPVSPAMVVKVRAALDDNGRPADWTAEIWSGVHSARPGSGNLLAAQALPEPPPEPAPADVPDAGGGGAVRNGTPLYDIAAKRFIHHLVPETPIRTSALRGLGAMPNVFAIECFIDELAERAGEDPVAYRLACLSDPRARAVIERVAKMSGWRAGVPPGSGRGRGIGFARYKDRAAYAAVVTELEADETIRLIKMWCAADAGLVVNPDGVINQLEGGMIQSASWVLKEQVRLETTGIASRDWETYPVLRFSEVPEIAVELLPAVDDVPLGAGEATAGPTAAAIGNAVAHALGARIRDLPLTRERIMATLLAG